jgi:hypothetical protein
MTDLHLPSSEKTLPLAVDNTGFLLDRMGEDCHPLQYLRELTQNGIEAILRTESKTGEIVWDVDWNWYDLENVYKLCVIDTGDGMTGPEMMKYINHLSSSVTQQSITGNYGVGAKIAAATRNHEGLIYLSWKQGEGATIHLWRDPIMGQYGLRQMKRPDNTFAHFSAIEETVKPDLIQKHGTKVVLLGNSQDQNTMEQPAGAASPSRWVSKYLNTRYFRFPAGVTVKAREGWQNSRSDTDRNVLRTITGQQKYLIEHAANSGSVALSSATAYWWILRDEKALTSNSGFVESSGHVAALLRDELYELTTARGGRALLQQFGVILGSNRVVIYVEPDQNGPNRITTNTSRTNLLLESQPLPWADWAAEFREKLPREIKQLIQSVAEGSSTEDYSKSIKDRLKQILDLYRLSRYRPTPSGELSIDMDRTARGGIPRSKDGSTGGVTPRQGNPGGSAGGIYSVFLKENGTPGVVVQPDPFPEVQWVTVKDGTRSPGDMEDRAARYLPEQNLLYINADFRAFTDMVKRWCHEFEDNPAVVEPVTAAVRGWFQQALMETVMGIQALQNSREWTQEDISKAVSEHALTAAVMQRYHVNVAVKRELGSKLGKLAVATVAPGHVLHISRSP